LAPEITSTSICYVGEGSVESSEELESTIPDTVALEVALAYIIEVELEASSKEQMIKFKLTPQSKNSHTSREIQQMGQNERKKEINFNEPTTS
jgi:hypothetical protein